MRALRGLLHVAGDFLGRRALLLDRGGDGRGDLRHPVDGAGDLVMAPTDCVVAAWMLAICWLISPVALAVCSASALTSEATTAKPRPASPARAASIVAFSASRLVWPAMVLISSTTAPIRPAASDNSPTLSLVCCAWSTASWAIRADSCTCRLISLTDEVSSSVADATDCTLVEACSEAAATATVNSCERSAVAVSVPAEASSSVEADDTVSMISPTAASNSFASRCMSCLRCSAALRARSCCCSRSKPACSASPGRCAAPCRSRRRDRSTMRRIELALSDVAIASFRRPIGPRMARMVASPTSTPSSRPPTIRAIEPPA